MEQTVNSNNTFEEFLDGLGVEFIPENDITSEKYIDKIPNIAEFKEYIGKNYCDCYLEIRKKVNPFLLIPLVEEGIIPYSIKNNVIVYINKNLVIQRFIQI